MDDPPCQIQKNRTDNFLLLGGVNHHLFGHLQSVQVFEVWCFCWNQVWFWPLLIVFKQQRYRLFWDRQLLPELLKYGPIKYSHRCVLNYAIRPGYNLLCVSHKPNLGLSLLVSMASHILDGHQTRVALLQKKYKQIGPLIHVWIFSFRKWNLLNFHKIRQIGQLDFWLLYINQLDDHGFEHHAQFFWSVLLIYDEQEHPEKGG